MREDLINQLKEYKVFDIVKTCQEYDEEYCLESFLEYRKKDILEAIDEINEDDNNQHKISVARKNKFAKIIFKFRERQSKSNQSKRII